MGDPIYLLIDYEEASEKEFVLDEGDLKNTGFQKKLN